MKPTTRLVRIARKGIKQGIKRFTLLATAIVTLSGSFASQAQIFTVDTSVSSPLTGLWWNAGESGWGATITQQSTVMFVTLFVYDVTGNPVWYTVSCNIAGASCSGDMVKFNGGATATAPWSSSGLNAAKVGGMVLNFTGNDIGAMTYTLNGSPVTRQITRQMFGPPAPVMPGLAGQWQGAIVETRNNCAQPQNNGGRATYGQYDIAMNSGTAGAIAITLSGVTGLQCTYAGNFTTNGARLQANGTLSCSDGKRGTWRSTNVLVTAKSMSLEFAVQLDTSETCTIAAILGGLRP